MLSGTALVLDVFIDYTITYWVEDWVEDSGSLNDSAVITLNAVNYLELNQAFYTADSISASATCTTSQLDDLIGNGVTVNNGLRVVLFGADDRGREVLATDRFEVAFALASTSGYQLKVAISDVALVDDTDTGMRKMVVAAGADVYFYGMRPGQDAVAYETTAAANELDNVLISALNCTAFNELADKPEVGIGFDLEALAQVLVDRGVISSVDAVLARAGEVSSLTATMVLRDTTSGATSTTPDIRLAGEGSGLAADSVDVPRADASNHTVTGALLTGSVTLQSAE